MVDASCPAPAAIEHLLLGLVSAEEARALEQHASVCPRCASTMFQTTAEDRLVRACRRAKEHATFPIAVDRLLPRLKRLIDTAPTGTYLPGTTSGDTRTDNASRTAPTSARVGSVLGPFLLLEVLGRGGMGVVFRARDPRLEREVALKIIRPELTARAGIVERFRSEARAAAAVEDDHIVGVYEVGEDGGVSYLAMPLLRGESLESRLRSASGGQSLVELLRIGREAAAGLAAAHARGLVHRDIKPSNIWLESAGDDAASGRGFARVKLLDFGLAGVVDAGAGHDVAGTPAYMSPEQARSLPTDGRADLFSLGVVLYQMATGTLPFAGPDARAILHSVVTEKPSAPAHLNPKLPRRLCALIHALLAKEPNDRPATAEAVVGEIEAIEHDLRPRRWWLIAAGVLVLAGAGVAGYLLRPPQPGAATADVTFDVDEGPGDVIVRDVEGMEVARFANGAGRTVPLRVGEYTAAYADTATKLRPWPAAFIVTAGRGLTVTLRPVGEAARYAGHTGAVSAAAFVSEKGLQNVSAAGGDFRPTIWHPDAREKPNLLPALNAPPLSIAVNANATQMAIGTGGKARSDGFEVQIVATGTWKLVQTFADHDDHITALAFTPDGRQLLTGLRDGRCFVRDLTTGKVKELPGHKGAVRSITVAPAAGLAVTAGGDRVVIWDLAAMQPTKDWGAPCEVRAAAFFRDGSAVVVAGADGIVRLWSAADGGIRSFKGHTGEVLAVAASANGNRLVSGGVDGTLRLWDVISGTEVIRERHDEKTAVTTVALSADGRHALSGGTDKTVRLWKLPD